MPISFSALMQVSTAVRINSIVCSRVCVYLCFALNFRSYFLYDDLVPVLCSFLSFNKFISRLPVYLLSLYYYYCHLFSMQSISWYYYWFFYLVFNLFVFYSNASFSLPVYSIDCFAITFKFLFCVVVIVTENFFPFHFEPKVIFRMFLAVENSIV